jgi:ketosteroid isomerase-like protein
MSATVITVVPIPDWLLSSRGIGEGMVDWVAGDQILMNVSQLISTFWQLMSSNDFTSVASVLHSDFVLEWPQSHERIRGAANFARMNACYPAHGPWRFTIQRLLVDGDAGMTEVAITDSVVVATAISFFTVRDGLISKIVEYWPDPFPAPAWRSEWVERTDHD